ncbi:FAD-dependent oxidoreductase [Allorhizobium sp. BGMRC 0089]|uniref:NAD(P)/FAD-dependent oxidoreductase n=1 Tax=Allorhizobium sonneratiae TaxID=2934936 RepID=UPI0020346AE0|nr:FAD-dependent oxidoreductase [Allorhizobium sonneratiae]MCM2291961.1 FAD-dependent oxidoreductase [Allorhizobium sonneratiae]
MSERLVIVGAGQAALSLAARLRMNKDERPITMIGLEPHPPYQRPPLSKKYLMGEAGFESLLLKPLDWYRDNHIDLRCGVWVEEIHRTSRQVRLQDGAVLDYDRLVLATGSSPRRLPQAVGGNLQGVYTVRYKEDADRLAEVMKPGRRLLIIGGGYIGLEAAAVARKAGLEVTLIEMTERILSRVAAKQTADVIRAIHLSHGVVIREATGLKRLMGENGRLTGAELADGSRLEIDMAIVGIGANANDDLASYAGLETRNGIIVDEKTSTADPAIHAVGDCALLPWGDQHIRLESVQNAVDQAEALADILTGKADAYRPHPWFWSDQYDVKLQIAGLNLGYDETVLRPGTRNGSLSIWYFRDGLFLAVDAINDAKAYMSGKKLLEMGRSVNKSFLSDATRDLKELLA